MASVKLRAGLVLLWMLCAACSVVALAWMALAVIVGSGRAWRIALGFDRLGNAMAGGDDGEYISSRCWRYRTEQPYRALRWVIDAAAVLVVGQAGHCEDSYRGEIERARQRLS